MPCCIEFPDTEIFIRQILTIEHLYITNCWFFNVLKTSHRAHMYVECNPQKYSPHNNWWYAVYDITVQSTLQLAHSPVHTPPQELRVMPHTGKLPLDHPGILWPKTNSKTERRTQVRCPGSCLPRNTPPASSAFSQRRHSRSQLQWRWWQTGWEPHSQASACFQRVELDSCGWFAAGSALSDLMSCI